MEDCPCRTRTIAPRPTPVADEDLHYPNCHLDGCPDSPYATTAFDAGEIVPASPPPKLKGRPATESQISFLKRLIAERDLEVEAVATAARHLAEGWPLSARDASVLIDTLLAIKTTKTPVRPNKWAGEC